MLFDTDSTDSVAQKYCRDNRRNKGCSIPRDNHNDCDTHRVDS